MTAGYSGTPLATKLGIKPDHRVVALRAPDGFADWLAPLPSGVRLSTRMVPHPDVVVGFVLTRRDLDRVIASASTAIFPDAALWIAWRKKASGVPTEVTEDLIRELALPRGLVDNKVCAISDIWSGLRLVWRKELRTR